LALKRLGRDIGHLDVLTADGEPIAEHEWRNDFLAVLEWAPGIDRPLAVGGPRAALLDSAARRSRSSGWAPPSTTTRSPGG
jgi:hypothetical protein